MFWNVPPGLPSEHLEELFGEPWEWVPGHWNVDFIQTKDLVTLFLSAAEVLLGWGPLAVLILTTFVKSLFTRSSTEKHKHHWVVCKNKCLSSGRLSPKGKCWLEQHCTLSTFPKTDCCGLSALPRKVGSCRPPIFAKPLFVESLPLVLSVF